MRRIITIFILAILSFLIQSAIFSYHNVMGSAPNLLLILTMSFGIMRGRREGLLVGVLSGFLYDIFFGSFIGPYMLLFMIIGYLNGAFHKDFLMEDIMLPVFIIAFDELVFNLVVYIASFLLRNRTDLGFYFIHVFLPQVFYTIVATVVVYRFNVWLNKFLKKKVKENATTI
ncbi:MAG: rod shape-determining protein MreD [Eubacterium sp.]|nr:rod shape-determining protein MreD [Eubacterium sp.]